MDAPPTSGPRIGQPAPDFYAGGHGGWGGDPMEVTLSAFRGRSRVVLAFFPLAFTGTCTAELTDFSHDFRRFEGLDAKVFGISVDSIPTLKAFRTTHGITVDLLSDFKRDVCRLYGTLLEDEFFASRSYFLVDREGVLRWSHTEAGLGRQA